MLNFDADILSRPLQWTQWRENESVKQLLQGLQSNILKGHGRDNIRQLFLDFSAVSDRLALKNVIRVLGEQMPSALEQLEAAENYKKNGVPGDAILCFFLRPAGYDALGVEAWRQPQSAHHKDHQPEAYITGMQGGRNGLNDPPLAAWQPELQHPVHAMLLVASDDVGELNVITQHWRERLEETGVVIRLEQAGKAIKRQVAGKMEGVEHFGYVDGRSQPLVLAEDVVNEPRDNWDPAFPLSQFLVADPGGLPNTSFGSYFVFRKLEQNVQGFKDREAELVHELGMSDAFGARAGALLVGRFEDGTPVVQAPQPANVTPVNDFNYHNDDLGSRCPFASHIRKTNPRGESPAHLNTGSDVATAIAQERSHIMIRRGITYGERIYDQRTNDFTDRPTTGAGLLFMAYMGDIVNQFEFTQVAWANNPHFVTKDTGIDPVIAQGEDRQVKITDGWGEGESKVVTFGQFVTLKGGEYFFTPSLDFLRSL